MTSRHESQQVLGRWVGDGIQSEVQQMISCRFAPEGRDVYSLAVLIFTPKLHRSAIAFPAPTKVPLPGFAPSGARSLGVRS